MIEDGRVGKDIPRDLSHLAGSPPPRPRDEDVALRRLDPRAGARKAAALLISPEDEFLE